MFLVIAQVTLVWLVHLYDDLVQWKARKFYYCYLRPILASIYATQDSVPQLNKCGKRLAHLAVIVGRDGNETEVPEDYAYMKRLVRTWRSFQNDLMQFALVNQISQVSIFVYLKEDSLVETIATILCEHSNVACLWLNSVPLGNIQRNLSGAKVFLNLVNRPQRDHHEAVLRAHAARLKERQEPLVELTVESLNQLLFGPEMVRHQPIDLVISTQRRLHLDLMLPWNIGFAQFSWQPGAPLDALLLRAGASEYMASKQNFGR